MYGPSHFAISFSKNDSIILFRSGLIIYLPNAVFVGHFSHLLPTSWHFPRYQKHWTSRRFILVNFTVEKSVGVETTCLMNLFLVFESEAVFIPSGTFYPLQVFILYPYRISSECIQQLKQKLKLKRKRRSMNGTTEMSSPLWSVTLLSDTRSVRPAGRLNFKRRMFSVSNVSA